MAAALKASLQLDLQDKLTAGLEKLEQQMQRLQGLAKSLGLGGLEDALDSLRVENVDALEQGLRGVERRADAAAAALRRMSNANDNVIRVNSSGGAFRTGASLGALTVVASGGMRGGGGGGRGAADAAFGSAPLMIEGPAGGGGIPLNLRPGYGRMGRAWGNLRATGHGAAEANRGLSEAAGNVASGAMSSAMEGFAVYEPIKAYAEFENVLRHIAITEKLQGKAVDAEVKRLTGMFNSDALATGQSSESIARAYSDLVQMGIRRSQADETIGVHSHAATAYNISAEAMGPAVGALLQNMHIGGGDLGGALAAMAYASKEGRFKVEDFSRQLPGTTGYLSLLGMTGRHSADIGFAAMETVMKNAAEPNQAAADFNDALHYLTAPVAGRSFAKEGIDLPKLLENAAKKGVNPLDAVLGKLDSKVGGMDAVQSAEYLGKLLHNQQAGMAILSLLQHKRDFLELRKTLDGVSQQTLTQDFTTAFAAPLVQMRLLNEQGAQLNRIMGEGFAGDLKLVGTLLHGLLAPLNWMNTNFPETTQGILAVVGGFLLLAAVVTAVGSVWGFVKAGFIAVGADAAFFGAILDGLVAVLAALLSPIGLVVGAVLALGAAAYGIYEHWGNTGHFFEDLWTGVKGTFNAFVSWVDSWTSGLGTRILAGIKGGWAVLVDGFGALITQLENRFDRFANAANGLQDKILGAHTPQIGGAAGGAGAPAGAAAGAAAGRADQLAITVQAAPGTAVTSISSSNPAHTIASTPNPGHTLNRP